MNLNQRKLLIAPAVFAVVVAVGLAAWMFIGSSPEPGASPPVVDSPDVAIHKPWRDAANHVQLAVVAAPSTLPSPALAMLDRAKESSLDDLKPVQLDSLGWSALSKSPQPATVNIGPPAPSPDVQTIQLGDDISPAAPAKKPDIAVVDTHKDDVAALADTMSKQIDLLSQDDDVVDPSLKFRRFVMSMCRDSQGRIWSGCEPDTEDAKDGGVWCYDPSLPKDKQWTQYTTADGLGDNYCYAIACDRKGRIWAGHLNHGVSVFNGQKWQNYDVVAGLSKPDSLAGPIGERVFHITVNQKDGDVWMATSTGLSRYSESPLPPSPGTPGEGRGGGDFAGMWRYYTRADGLPSDQASSIAFDADGNIYVATQCDGVAMANASDDYKTWRQVKGPDQEPTTPTGDGIPSNLTNDVLVAHDGTIYLATDAGLAWSKDKGVHWQFVRGADWADKVRGLYGGPPKDWKETPGAILAEDYCTCLAANELGNLFIGHRRLSVESLNVLTGETSTLRSPDFARTILADDGLQIASYGHGEAILNPSGHFATDPASTNIALPRGAPRPTLDQLETMASASRQNSPSSINTMFIGEDWQTEGDYVGRYGKQEALLCAAESPYDDDLASNPVYSIHGDIGPSNVNGDSLRRWIHWMKTDSQRSLYDPALGYRRQAEWDDHGETLPMSTEGPGLVASFELPQGVHRVSLYFMNKDGQTDANRFRDYLIMLCSLDLKSNEVPSTECRVVDFRGGVYESFLIASQGKFRIRIKRNNSLNTICSGIFIDKLAGPVDFHDALPGLYMGNRFYNPPPQSEPDGTIPSPISRQVSDAARLIDSNWSYGFVLRKRGVEILTLRLVGYDGAFEQLRQRLHWNSFVWDAADRERFDSEMKLTWQAWSHNGSH